MKRHTQQRTIQLYPQLLCVRIVVAAVAALSILVTPAFAEDPKEESVEVAIATPLKDSKSNSIENVTVVANIGTVDEAPTAEFHIVDRDLAKSRIAQLVSDTETAMWKAKIMEIMGDETEHSSISVAWAGPELQRIKVKKGRGAGKTLLVRGDMVSSGWLKFRHTHSMVKTVRGNSLKLNGYLDDLAHLLTDWESVTLTDDGDDWIIEFIAPNGVDSKLWIDSTTLKASKMEAREEGALVGTYEYDSVIYNPKFPSNFFKK